MLIHWFSILFITELVYRKIKKLGCSGRNGGLAKHTTFTFRVIDEDSSFTF
ncbi:MAG: hypothetical protein QOK89_08150 [Nitrososphaeraceae archaeon]|nr:hypothetical protein [Nitrososphaeraceae archaeon]